MFGFTLVMDPPSRNALQESGEGLAAGAGSGGIVVDQEAAAEVHGAASGGRFKDRELFEAKFAAELHGMASVRPAQIIGKNIAVLVFNGGQKLRGANGSRCHHRS